MTRNIKTFGPALVAALALTAVMASTASAQFTSSAASTTISGSQVEAHKFTAGTGIGAIDCEFVVVNGSHTGASSTTLTTKITIGPTCTDSLGRLVHVIVNTLEYHLLSGVDKGKAHLTGELKFRTTSAFGNCEITIKGLQTLNGYTYSQSGNDLLVSTHTNNLHSSISGGGFACGTSATTSATGTYTGTTLMKGNSGAAKISVH